MDNLKRIVIVGNGFDIAHGLKTTYIDFFNKSKSTSLSVIPQYDELMRKLNICDERVDKEGLKTWYAFEKNFESIVRRLYVDEHVNGVHDNLIEYANGIFSKIEEQLSDYLQEEYCSKKESIILKDSIRKYVTEDTLFISFNYTDTVKLYSKNYYYVHGSISDDNCIILGFADGETSCLQCGDYTRYLKEEKRELLEFCRFCNRNGLVISDAEKAEFSHHIDSLYSPRGEYDLKRLNDGSYDIKDMSVPVRKYAEHNNFAMMKEPYDYSEVEEVVIAGHGLESDHSYLKSIFAQSNVRKIVLFQYDDDKKIMQKKKELLKLSGLNEDSIIKEKY